MLKRFLLAFVFVFCLALPAAGYTTDTSIDIVYTWVDGSDALWCKERDKHLFAATGLINQDASSKNKYRNRNELKYSMRSILAYAPWFHHIYIVTNGQVPKWLKKHPKVTIVTHEQIFKDKNYLPTFSSIAIEANLHRIPGLAEKYIYFNDDVFLAAPTVPEDFFMSDGKPKVIFKKKRYTPRGIPVKGELASHSAWKNTNLLLDMLYCPSERYPVAHVPFAFTKSLVSEVENKFPGITEVNSSFRFRHPSSIAFINGFIQYYGLHAARAVEGEIASMMIILRDDLKQAKKRLAELSLTSVLTFCIEDGGYEGNNKVDEALVAFLEDFFPLQAPWEQNVPSTRKQKLTLTK